MPRRNTRHLPYDAFDHALRAVVHATMAREADRLNNLARGFGLTDGRDVTLSKGLDSDSRFRHRALDMLEYWEWIGDRRIVFYLWLPADGVLPKDKPAAAHHLDIVHPPFYLPDGTLPEQTQEVLDRVYRLEEERARDARLARRTMGLLRTVRRGGGILAKRRQA